jgi:autotransporter-associated beta strand protein
MRPMTRIVLICVLLLTGYARAITRTWTGGGADDNWSTAGNWSPSGVPAPGDALVFAGVTRLSPNNDLASGTSFFSITFNAGAGNFTLNGNPLSLSGGSNVLVSNAASGQMTLFLDISITATSTLTVASGGTMLLLGTFNNAGWPISANAQGNLQFGGPITGAGAMTMTGANGVVRLSGYNGGFSGAITVSAGTLVLDHPNGLGTTGQGTTVAAGAVLDMNGVACATAEPLTLYGTGISSTGALVNNAVGGAVFPGPITLGAAALISAANGPLTLSGTTPIAGNYALTLGGTGPGSLAAGLGSGIAAITKAGSGTWSLFGTGSASVGGTTVSGGTLDLGNPGSIGSGGITLNGGNLSFHDNGSGSNSLIDYGRGLTLVGGATATITVANAGANTGNSIRLGSLTCGNATLNLTGANGYRLETGPVTLNGSPSGSIFLNPTGADLVIGSVTGGAYPYILDLGGTSAGNRINGVIADGSASVSIAKGGSSVWMLAGANTFSGTTSINGGALVLGSGQALGSAAGGTTVASGAMLDLGGTTYASAEPLTLNGTGIAGSGALVNSNPAAAIFPGPISLGSASSIVGESGAINLTQAGSLGGPYTLTLGGSQGGSFSANPSSGSLAKTGTGTWTRSGSSGLALSSLSLSQGTFALGAGMLHTLSSNLSVSGGVLDFGSSTLQVSASSVDLSALAGLTAGTGTLEFSSAANQAFIPATVGNPKLKKSGAGPLIVNGPLDAGALTLTAGTWDWGSGTLNHAVNGIAASGSSAMVFGSNTVTVREGACDLSGLGSLNAGSGQLVLYSTGSQGFTPLAGSGHPKVVKTGSGTTSLLAADLTSAGMQVQAGTLDLGNRAVTVNGNLSVAGGNLEAIGAGLTVTGDLALSGGNLSMPSGILYVAGNVSSTGGTAAHNNGWLTLNGPSPGKTFDFPPTLYNLNVNASGGGWVAANHGFAVANLFQVQYGSFGLGTALGHSAASFNSMGGTLDFGSATLAITGATAYFPGLASLTTGSGTLEFSGSGTQAFYPINGYAFPTVKRSGTGTAIVTGGPLLVNTLALAGGTLNLGAGLVTTASALSITGGNLDFASGILKLGGATADFTSLASLTPGAGTLEFNGSVAQTFIPKASLTFPGLTQSGTGGTTVATNGFSSNGPLTLVYGTFDLGASLSHSAASLDATAGSLAFNSSSLSVTSGNANLSTVSSLSAGTGALAFTAASGTQTLTPKYGSGHPAILHTGAGTLALANYDLSCLSFAQTAGTLDFNGRDIATTAGGAFSIANGTSSTLANLSGRTLTVAGNASFAGASAANRLNLDPASAWTLAVGGSLTASLASLGNSSASVSAGACGDCSDAGGNSNWTYSVHWVGGGGSPNWSLAANWGSGSVPAVGADVLFDSGIQNALLDVSATVKSLTMAGGYTGAFDFGTHTLNVTGNADFRSGGSIVPGAGALAFTGTGAQAFVPKPGAAFPAIVQNANAGTTTVTTHPLNAASLALGLGTFHLGSSLTHTVGAVSGSGALDFGTSNLNATGNVNLASATVTASGSNTLAFTGGSAQTYVPNGSVSGLKLAQNGPGGTAVANYDFATPALSVIAGILDLGTGRTHSAASVSVSGGGLDFKSSTLRVAGASVDFSALASLTAGTGTLEFNGASPQAFIPKASVPHPNVKQNGAGGVTVSGNDLVTGTLSVTSGAFALGPGRTVTASGLALSGGTLDFTGGTLKTSAATIDLGPVALLGAASGTLEFTANGAQTFVPKAAAASPGIVHSGTGVTTLATNALSTASLLVSAGGFDLATLPLASDAIAVTGGALTATNGSIDLNGNLSVTAGRIDCPGAGPFAISGNVAIAAAAVVGHNSGTLTLDGTAAGKTLDIDNIIYGLTVNGTGGAWAVANHRLWTEGALTLANGSLSLGTGFTHSAGSVTASGGALDFGGSTLRILYANANLGGLAALTPGTGVLEFMSTGANQILIPKPGANHPAIAHTGSAALQISANDLICKGFSNTSGGLDLNGRNLTVNNGGNLTIANGASATIANLAGTAIAVAGNAAFSGISGANRLNLDPASGWTLAVAGTLTASLVSLANNTATASAGTCTNCSNGGGNANWTFLDSIPPSPLTAFQARRAGGHAVRLAWTPSASPDADSVMIRYRADGAYPTGRADGTLWRMVPKTDTLDTAYGLPDKAILAFAAFARDSSGNYAASAASAQDTAFMPDVTAPSNAKAFVATAFSPSASALSWAAPDSADADSIQIRYRTDGQYPADAGDGTWLRTVAIARTADTATGLTANVTYHFGLFARDSSGNWSVAAPGARDSSLYQAPVLGSVAVLDSQGFTRDTDPALLFTASGADSLRFGFLPDTALAAWVAVRSRDSLDLGTGPDGKRIVAAQFKNAYGRRSAWYLDTTVLDRAAPVAALDLKPAHSWRDWPNAAAGSARDGLAGTDSVFVLRKRLADGYAYNGSGWTTVPDTARFRADSVFSAPLPGSAMATGAYEFTVWAKDRLGNVSSPLVRRVDYTENRPPELATADPADSVYQNQPADWSIAIGDRDAGDSVLAVSVAAPPWLRRSETADSGQGGFAFRRVFAFSGTPAQADVAAASVLTVQVRDLGGRTFLYSKAFAVIDVNDAPAFASGRDSVAAKEHAVTRYVPRFRDPDPADKGTLALLAAPAWATLEDSAVVLRPGTRDIGRALVRITVSDGRLSDTLDLDVDAVNQNDAPVAFPGDRWPGTTAWKEDVPDSFTVVVVDMDRNDRVDLLTPLPAFLSYRESADSAGFNHFFRFASAPAQKDTGSYPIRLRFADAAGATSELAFTAKVASVNDTPLAVIASVRTAAGAARIGLDVKDEDGGAAATRFHYRLIDARGDTVRTGICAGASLALQPLADGEYTLALAAEDEGGLRQSAYTRTGLGISGATARAVDSARWDMLAYPGSALAASALGAGADLATWDEASGDGSPGRYASGKAADSLFRGKGYWVKAPRRLVLSAPLAGLLDKPYPLKLVRGKQGWNQIGNPFPYYVDLSATGFTFWEWDPVKRDLSDAKGILKPWGAYWIQVSRDTMITIANRPWFPAASAPLARAAALRGGAAFSPADGTVPDGIAPMGSGAVASDPDNWSLQLSLSAGPYRDESNFLGIRRAERGTGAFRASAAGTGPDGLAPIGLAPDGTLGEAPKFGEYVALRFERPGSGKMDGLERGFAADFRPGLSGDEEWWDFAVENRATGLQRAVLGLPGLQGLAARGLYAFLVDRGEARPLPASGDAPVELAMGDSVAHYSLVITSHPDFAAVLKGNFNISQNFPNPARGMTTFRFFLPQAWGADGKRQAKAYRLKLNVYDYRGRLAATVAEGPFAPGPHTLAWRPQAKGGGPLAPGAYVYRLEAAGFAKSLKLLVK